MSPFLWSRTKLARAVVTVWLFALFAGLASGVTTFTDGRVAQRSPSAVDPSAVDHSDAK